MTTYVVAQDTAGHLTLAEDSSQSIEAQADKMEIDEETGQIRCLELSKLFKAHKQPLRLFALRIRVHRNDLCIWWSI